MSTRRFALPVFCALFLLLGCDEKTSQPQWVETEDRDNGFVLRLRLDKKRYKVGEAIVAIASLENTTDKPMAVHYFDIRPAYIPVPTPSEKAFSLGVRDFWYSAYADLIPSAKITELVGFHDHEALLEIAPPPDLDLAATKGWYEALLEEVQPIDADGRDDAYLLLRQGQRKGQGWPLMEEPKFIMPASTVVSMTRRTEAVRGQNFINSGLFCFKNFFAKKILERWNGEVCPQIWFGSLYVGIKIEVE